MLNAKQISCLLLSILTTATLAFAAEKKGVAAKPAAKKMNTIVVIEMQKGGIIKLELFDKDMPITTKNFIELIEKKFYDGLTFHRVEPGFVVQGGDPTGTGTGSSNRTIKLEINPNVKWDSEGQLGMARSAKPDSASCQFFITLDAAPWLNKSPHNDGYALFGKVISGMDVVKKIKVGDVMKTVRIEKPVPKK